MESPANADCTQIFLQCDRSISGMDTIGDSTSAKVYTVNGAASGSSSSLPDWLTRKRASKKGKRSVKEHYEGTINLVQEFEFPGGQQPNSNNS